MTEEIKSALPGTNVLLMGPAGTGKTHSIGTLVESGIEVFYLGLEPGLESLLGYFTDRGLPVPPNLHYHQLAAPKASFMDMIDSAKKINTMALDSLAKMVDPKKANHDQFIKLLESLNNFHDDRTGLDFGSVDTWGPGRALVMDGMAGLCRASMSLVVGGKPVKNQSDWGIAMDNVERILRMLTDNCRCHFVLIAHVERETDAVLGGVKISLSSLGSKLSPKVAPMFSDVILTVREGPKFSWDTGSALADVKTRNLKIASGLPPSFGPVIEKWKSRGGL
jgi:Fe-S-cluster formation regulator IscX/YfhJ